jgi:hypothetical protein
MKKCLSKSKLRNKCDKLIQEWGRRTYKSCLVCSKSLSCLHHYYPKSVASSLRYDKDNLIPLCVGCHFRHHNGDPRIHNYINEIMGDKWLESLTNKKNTIIKTNIDYYQEIIKQYGNQ